MYVVGCHEVKEFVCFAFDATDVNLDNVEVVSAAQGGVVVCLILGWRRGRGWGWGWIW